MFFKIRFIFLLSLKIIFFFGISSCANSLNQENYIACREELETDRQKVRKVGGFSYEAKSFEECRSPANYRTGRD